MNRIALIGNSGSSLGALLTSPTDACVRVISLPKEEFRGGPTNLLAGFFDFADGGFCRAAFALLHTRTYQANALQQQRHQLALPLYSNFFKHVLQMGARCRSANPEDLAAIVQRLAFHQQIRETSF